MADHRSRALGWAKAIGFLVALNAFFVAIHLLGAFKDIGSGYGETLMAGLANRPILGVLVGLLVTSILQSSSTTTALAVGLAASGCFGADHLEALETAVPIVMGANIGTTVTNTIVSFGHVDDRREFRRAFSAATVHDMFNLLTVAVLLPLQVATNFLGRLALLLAESLESVGGLAFASPLRFVVQPQAAALDRAFDHQWVVDLVVVFALVLLLLSALGFIERRRRVGRGAAPHAIAIAGAVAIVIVVIKAFHTVVFSKPTGLFVLGLILLLGALYAVVKIMRSVVLDRVARLFHEYMFKSWPRALVVGLVLTAIVQSSSVTTSMVVPLAGAGLVTIRQVFPYALGANLGTTVTALLAALSLSETTALALALAHFFFNVFGIALFLPLARVPIAMAEALARASEKSRVVPVVYTLGVYILLPALLIWFCEAVG